MPRLSKKLTVPALNIMDCPRKALGRKHDEISKHDDAVWLFETPEECLCAFGAVKDALIALGVQNLPDRTERDFWAGAVFAEDPEPGTRGDLGVVAYVCGHHSGNYALYFSVG